MPQVIRPDGFFQSTQRFGLYRWHLPDPIHFATDLRVEIQALGWQSGGRFLQLHDDIASTAFFYLDMPSTARPDFPEPTRCKRADQELGQRPPMCIMCWPDIS